jgi:NADH:ubiquinone oxidoreductase subunit F (NADH-binding)
MNFEQVYTTAESKLNFINNKEWIKIYVVSLSDISISKELFKAFQVEIEKNGLKAEVIMAGSFGYYDLEPVVIIEKPEEPRALFKNVTPEKTTEFVDAYLIKDNRKPEMVLSDTSDLLLFNLQKRVALRNCGHINPENIAHYILQGKGYSGLSKALKTNRTALIDQVKKSGLRGRGRAGFDAADKWRTCHDEESAEKYAICNAVDSDPSARTMQLLLEGDPHSVLEGLLIGAYAVSASRCFVAVNEEYTVAIKRLETALDQMREYCLLGENILDSSFNCEIEIIPVEGSLVAGEETALLQSVQKKQAMPYVRPPYPATKGFAGKPTLIHNIETLSNISALFQNEGVWDSAIGTDQSKGTKVITITGDVVHKYTIEVPFGTTIRHIVEDIGGGVSNGRGIKAVQLGGPTGAFFSVDSLDIPLDYETIVQAGSMIGSGTIRVFDGNSCAVEITNDIMTYVQSQSCGKCVFCREGTLQMSDILKDISEKKGKPQDLDLLKELGAAMKNGCICGLGRTASNPVLSSIELFRNEFESHIKEKRCPYNGDKEG